LYTGRCRGSGRGGDWKAADAPSGREEEEEGKEERAGPCERDWAAESATAVVAVVPAAAAPAAVAAALLLTPMPYGSA
jgi:hypothetical protein